MIYTLLWEIFSETRTTFFKTLFYLFIVFLLLIGSTQLIWSNNYYYIYRPFETMDFDKMVIVDYGRKNISKIFADSKEMVHQLIVDDAAILLTLYLSYIVEVNGSRLISPIIAIVDDYEGISLLGVDMAPKDNIPILVFSESLTSEGAPQHLRGRSIQIKFIILDTNRTFNLRAFIHSQPLFNPSGLLIIKYGTEEFNQLMEIDNFSIFSIIIRDSDGDMEKKIVEIISENYGYNLSIVNKSDELEVMNMWRPELSNLFDYYYISYWMGIVLGGIILVRNSFLFISRSKDVVGLYMIYGVLRRNIIISFLILLLILGLSSVILSSLATYYIFTLLNVLRLPPINIYLYISFPTMILAVTILSILAIIFTFYKFSVSDLEEYVSTGEA